MFQIAKKADMVKLYTASLWPFCSEDTCLSNKAQAKWQWQLSCGIQFELNRFAHKSGASVSLQTVHQDQHRPPKVKLSLSSYGNCSGGLRCTSQAPPCLLALTFPPPAGCHPPLAFAYCKGIKPRFSQEWTRVLWELSTRRTRSEGAWFSLGKAQSCLHGKTPFWQGESPSPCWNGDCVMSAWASSWKGWPARPTSCGDCTRCRSWTFHATSWWWSLPRWGSWTGWLCWTWGATASSACLRRSGCWGTWRCCSSIWTAWKKCRQSSACAGSWRFWASHTTASHNCLWASPTWQVWGNWTSATTALCKFPSAFLPWEA